MPQDTGIYTCVAVNDHGSASSSASIKVQGEGEGCEGPKATQALAGRPSGTDVFLSHARHPSSPCAASGAAGQQHSGDRPLAPPSQLGQLCRFQLHCGVPTGR